MPIAAGEVISAAEITAALVIVGAKTDFTISSPTGTGWYRTAGPMVELSGVTTGTLAAGSSATVYTLPSGVRPAVAVNLACGGGVAFDREVSGMLNTDGTIVIRNNYSSAVAVSFHGLYLLP